MTIKRHILALFNSFIIGQGPRIWKMVGQCSETFPPDMQCGSEVHSFNKYLFIVCYMTVARITEVRDPDDLDGVCY